MWIKKISKSLYTVILVRMIIAAAISSFVLQLLLFGSDFLVAHQKKIAINRQSQAVEEIVANVQNKVVTEKLTLAQAVTADFVEENKGFEVYIVNSSMEILNYNDFEPGTIVYFSGDSFVHEIKFYDVNGYIIVNPKKGNMVSHVYYAISVLLSVFTFLILSVFLLMKVFSYLRTISEGVKIIEEKDLRYKIPVKGSNELSLLATGINTMGENLYQKNEAEKIAENRQRMLITNISHDLRTPLTAIIGYLGLIRQNTFDSDMVSECADVAEKNSLRLKKLIDDLFVYTKLISNDVVVNFSVVDISIFIGQLIEIQPMQIEFHPAEKKLFAEIDIDKFQRIMDNLFDNIKKYGVKNEPACVAVYQKNNWIYIEVKNKTASLLAEKVRYLTDRLYTGNEERNEGSSGLGLSIVSELVKCMNGKLAVEYNAPEVLVKMSFPRIEKL